MQERTEESPEGLVEGTEGSVGNGGGNVLSRLLATTLSCLPSSPVATYITVLTRNNVKCRLTGCIFPDAGSLRRTFLIGSSFWTDPSVPTSIQCFRISGPKTQQLLPKLIQPSTPTKEKKTCSEGGAFNIPDQYGVAPFYVLLSGSFMKFETWCTILRCSGISCAVCQRTSV